MKEAEFNTLTPLLEHVHEKISAFLESSELHDLRTELQETAARLPKSMAITLNVIVEVFDEEREASINLLETGITSSGETPAYRSGGQAPIQRYVVNGEIYQLPEDQCPACWEMWALKDMHRTCDFCEVTFGKEVKILLDGDMCPHCGNRGISASSPFCTECGYEPDPEIVMWG